MCVCVCVCVHGRARARACVPPERSSRDRWEAQTGGEPPRCWARDTRLPCVVWEQRPTTKAKEARITYEYLCVWTHIYTFQGAGLAMYVRDLTKILKSQYPSM
jgi:hypothetical protein